MRGKPLQRSTALRIPTTRDSAERGAKRSRVQSAVAVSPRAPEPSAPPYIRYRAWPRSPPVGRV